MGDITVSLPFKNFVLDSNMPYKQMLTYNHLPFKILYLDFNMLYKQMLTYNHLPLYW